MIRLSNMPMPHVINMAHSVLDMFRVNSPPENKQCAASAPEVIHGQSAVLRIQGSFISPADWDELFVAVQARLENCVDSTLHHSSTLSLQDQKSIVKKTVLECVDAMQRLHHSLNSERQSQLRG